MWVNAMADQYPVQAYLYRINQITSAECPFCSETRETVILTHFACVCPRFRECHTVAHNQVRKLISSLLAKCPHNRWELHEGTHGRVGHVLAMANTGLRLNRASVSCMGASGHPSPRKLLWLYLVACNLTGYSSDSQ